jgi:hypothetical protein
MPIYNEILNWSKSKSPWMQDALRRLIIQSKITDDDIDDLFKLLKKENGYSYPYFEAITLNYVLESSILIKRNTLERPILHRCRCSSFFN